MSAENKENIEDQILQKALKVALQRASSLDQLIFLEALRGLRTSGLERTFILANCLLLATKDEQEREELNKIKMIAGRLKSAKAVDTTVSIYLPLFAYEDPSFLAWLSEIELAEADALRATIEKDAQRYAEKYAQKNGSISSKDKENIRRACKLIAFTYPSLEAVVHDFCVWSENILLQKLSKLLGGEQEET
ncbi:MAG: hypothetical protein ACPLZY_04255 [Candidatus Norongarragalinales archaeon]